MSTGTTMPETTATQTGSKVQAHVVLFVDDERNILSSVQRILRRAPYRVLTANSPELGLELIQKHAVTLVVSDFRMPTMDGVSFLEKVRDLSPDTVRMLLTGFADTDSAIRAINNGNVFRYLKKPIREPELLEALRTGVRQYELVVEN
ncbi:MAG: response regulator, partial [Calditrichaeota bacterium]